jgi:hypothetical protein
MHVENGVPADQIEGARWRKSRVSNPNGSCVEVTGLTDGSIAIRNSRHPSGPALVYTQAEMAAFLQGAKDGEFDNLIIGLPNRMLRRRARPATDGSRALGWDSTNFLVISCCVRPQRAEGFLRCLSRLLCAA